MKLARLWFGFEVPVSRRAYAWSGFGLMVLKYGVEALLIRQVTGKLYAPLDFLSPLLSMRERYVDPPAPPWLAFAVVAWTLPFLWILLSMTLRRLLDAGRHPAWSLLVLLPFVNYATLLALCLLPSRPGQEWSPPEVSPAADHPMRSAMLGIAAGVAVAAIMLPLAVYVAGDYGASLFVGTPVVIGAAAAFLYNRPSPRYHLGASLAVAQIAVLLSGLAVLLFAAEGVLCLAMALPVGASMALLGGLVGHALGARGAARGANLVLLLLCLPILAGAETWRPPPPMHEVITALEIDAPPEAVWPHVIGFEDLTEPPPWYFALGIAYPLRATIDGSGVGAVRYCVFSTGSFVEPITAWEPPYRLAFDVASQPPPMRELSPWGEMAAPHLDGTLTSRRGEFRLIALPGGRTRLEGSTWYELDMAPGDYWCLWSDLLIGRIHSRVLEHIARLAETPRAD